MTGGVRRVWGLRPCRRMADAARGAEWAKIARVGAGWELRQRPSRDDQKARRMSFRSRRRGRGICSVFRRREQKQILRGVDPERRTTEILRFAQDDKRRAEDDKRRACPEQSKGVQDAEFALSTELRRTFAELTLSELLGSFAALRTTSEEPALSKAKGLRMTSEGRGVYPDRTAGVLRGVGPERTAGVLRCAQDDRRRACPEQSEGAQDDRRRAEECGVYAEHENAGVLRGVYPERSERAQDDRRLTLSIFFRYVTLESPWPG
jgi:hypothetical protein